MKQKFELTLTPEYASSWELQDALRELVQNGLDQQVQHTDNILDIKHFPEDEALEISNKESVLSKRSLLLGYTSKSNDQDTIGQFGEGYKIALLVLTRLGKKVVIYNYGNKEVWTSKLVKSRRFEGEHILQITVDTDFPWKKKPHSNLVIRVEGITQDDYSELESRTLFLQDMNQDDILETKRGQILLSDKYAGKLYVDGLYVGELDKFTYGYSIKPKYLKIGRDRNLVNGFDTQYETSQMWRESGYSDALYDLITKESPEVSYLTTTFTEDTPGMRDLANKAYIQFKKDNGTKSIPVKDNKQLERVKRTLPYHTPIIVGSSFSDLLAYSTHYKKETKVNGLVPKSPLSLFNEWIDGHYGLVLDSEAIEKLNNIVLPVIGG